MRNPKTHWEGMTMKIDALRPKSGFAISVCIAIGLLSSAAPDAVQAGIFRDMLSSVGLAKPDQPPSNATGAPSFPRNGYACCNFHYSKDWINDGNYADLPMIAAGTPIQVVKYGRDRAYVTIDGKQYGLGHDYGRSQETLDVWVNKVVVNDDPRPRIASYPFAVQEAIRQGKVMVGMTREQCIVAVGYPMTAYNASLDENTWHIWRSTHEEYQLNFGPDGHLQSVTGDDEVTTQMLYRPGR
jgi:hypothetical protein